MLLFLSALFQEEIIDEIECRGFDFRRNCFGFGGLAGYPRLSAAKTVDRAGAVFGRFGNSPLVRA